LLSGGICTAKEETDISDGARAAIECMSNVLAGVPNAENVRFFVSHDSQTGYFPVLAYSFVGRSGMRHDVQLPINNNPDQAGFRSYSLGAASIDGGGPWSVVAMDWEKKCKVMAALVIK
jgi:hypothetical protein